MGTNLPRRMDLAIRQRKHRHGSIRIISSGSFTGKWVAVPLVLHAGSFSTLEPTEDLRDGRVWILHVCPLQGIHGRAHAVTAATAATAFSLVQHAIKITRLTTAV